MITQRTLFLLLAAIVCCSFVLTGCRCAKKEVRKAAPYRVVRGTISFDDDTLAIEKRIQGFSNDLFFAIAQMSEMKLQIETVNGIVSLQLLDSPHVDAIVTLIQPTPALLRNYLFSDPFFVEGPVIVSRFGENFDSLSSLKDKVVGIERGYLGTLEQSEAGQEPADLIFQPFDTTSDMIEALSSRRVEAIIMNSIIASKLARGLYWGKIDVTSPPLRARGVRLVVKRGHSEELIESFNAGLKQLMEEGTYGRMLSYWDLFNAQDPSSI